MPELQKFLLDKDAVILQGRSLYPRQFSKGDGLDISVYDFYHTMPYPRTLFTVLSPKGQFVIILPRVVPAKIANSIDVMVLGCLTEGYVQGWAILQMDNHDIFERIPPGAPLACPLLEPVCDDNKNCH